MISDKIEEAEVTRSANSDLADIMQILEKYNQPAAAPEKAPETDGGAALPDDKKDNEEPGKETIIS